MSTERIIVLAAGAMENDGKFAEFKDGMYLGGQVRLEAAAQLAHDRSEAELTIVGGYNKTTEGDPLLSNKVRDMADFITNRCPAAHVRLVCSLPCTHHNFVAVFNNWAADGIDADKISILTSSHHMERAKEFASQAAMSFEQYAQLHYIPLRAEEILARPIESIIGDKQDQYIARLESERRGLEQLRAGTYVDSCLTRNIELLRPVLDQRGAVLLTRSELLDFHK